MPSARRSLEATNVLQVVSPSDVPFLPFSNAFLLFDFDGPEVEHYNHFPDPMLETEGAGAPGDSGSLIYADFDGENFIVGINSGGRFPGHLLPAINLEDATPELFAQYGGSYGIVGGASIARIGGKR